MKNAGLSVLTLLLFIALGAGIAVHAIVDGLLRVLRGIR